MKTIYLFIIGILCTLLQACAVDDDAIITSAQTVQIDNNTKSSAIPLPVISKNQVIIRYKTYHTPSQKRALRDRFFVLDSTRCSCGDDDLELWTINKDSIDVEEAVDNIDAEADLEGDHQFFFKLDDNDALPLQETALIQDKLAPLHSNAVNIAVIDTGVAYDYFEDPFLYYNPDQVDCRSEISGWDFVNKSSNIRDDHGHGTLVTKLITSTLDAHSINHRILPVKAFDKAGNSSYWNLVCATNYVVNKRPAVDVVNMSFGWYGVAKQDIMQSLIYEARKTTVFVASAGNQGIDTDSRIPHFPSGYEVRNLLTVAGFQPTEAVYLDPVGNISKGIELSEISNYGSISIDMVAPFAYQISIPNKENDIVDAQGTSFSSAFVSARAAELFKNFTSPYRVRKYLLDTAYFSEEMKKNTREGKVILNEEKIEKE
ncbi:S8 family peptidase [Aquimarina algicola]|uniref:Peptidase S8/S53 domain-containing protein n=1 Tax=Aquimarina algicola TaxID=2589995 RepID=A0A504J9T8_9FLAO|nr:S8 family serine peptidase [Aquimarina algicola]TPN87696.1 hypothetical protein FHK87_08960 [Aquimarina algicola]